MTERGERQPLAVVAEAVNLTRSKAGHAIERKRRVMKRLASIVSAATAG
jgi:hypothetical protein